MAPEENKTPPGVPEDIYKLVVEYGPTAEVLAGRDGRIVLVNSETEKLFGYSRQELLGQPVELLVPERFRARHPDYRESYHASPGARAMGAGRDLYGRHKDGSEIPIEIGLNPIKNGEYVLAGIVDISERKELERKLVQSEAMAAVGAMAAVLAHEVRNPLGSIVMAARSLGRPDLDPSDRELVSKVLSEESERLNRTLQDFLNYSRPREPRREEADLNALVLGVVQALDHQYPKVEFVVRLAPELTPFPFDADQVRQVVWNLIINAVQATAGKGPIEVATVAEEGRAAFWVSDSGPGIPAAVLPKIFDPFFTTKRKGTGLGLAIAKRIIAAHGGVLKASNRSEGGARFALTLPRPKP